MAKQNILVGASANDKTGDTLRNAFVKANANFTELYTLTGGTAADLRELAQDYAAPLFNHASHTNITVTYDDANNKILLTGAAPAVWPVVNTAGASGPTKIAIGANAGLTSQAAGAVAIGNIAGVTNQGQIAVAIGMNAGNQNQGGWATAVGSAAGYNAQGTYGVAVGYLSGYTGQGSGAVAVGAGSANGSQGANAVAVGYQAGNQNQGAQSIAVGANAGATSQAANTIILNATGSAVNGVAAQTDSFYVAPIRTATATSNVLYYNTTTKEVTYAAAGSVSSLVNGVHTLSLGSTGNTTFPTGLVLGAPRGPNTVNFTCSVDKEFQIETGTASAGRLWQFGTTGTTTFPSGLTLHRLSSSYSNITADLNKILQVATQTSGGRKEWSFGTDGALTLPSGGVITEGSTFDPLAMKLKPASGANAYQALLIYPTAAEGDHIHLASAGGTTELYLGTDTQYVRLVNSGNVQVQASTANFSAHAAWNFSTDGNLSLPNSAVIGQASDVEITAAATAYTDSLTAWEAVRASYQAQANNLGLTSSNWPFIAWQATGPTAAGLIAQLLTAYQIQQSPSSPPLPLIFQPPITTSAYNELRSALIVVRDSYATWQALLTSVKITSGSESVTLMSNGKLIVPNIIQTDPEENLVIRTRYAVVTSPPGIGTYSNKDFTFGTNGSLTFPDTTVQSTAYVNRITNTSTTNTTMLTVNTNVVNRDRLSIRAVSPTAGSINVEFRYIGINGANVTISANNGTNIFGYSTTGAAIGWQQFNPVVFEHVGDKAEMVISDHSYHKVYRVTAMMRDTPTQYQLGSVYCIIEELM